MTAEQMFIERTEKTFHLFVALEVLLMEMGSSMDLTLNDRKMFGEIYRVFKLLGSHENEHGPHEYSYYSKTVESNILPEIEKLMLRLIGNDNEDEIIKKLNLLKSLL